MSIAELFSAATENWCPQMKQGRDKDSDFVKGRNHHSSGTLLEFCSIFIEFCPAGSGS